jgi:hypothetical protein
MKFGFAQAVITPRLDKPVYLAGFGKNRRAETVHDDLTVRALALSSATDILVLCALDLIGFFRPDIQDVIRRVRDQHTGIIKPDILIASIHTHHGPDTQGLWGPDDRTSGVNREYMNWLKDKIVATIMLALADAHHSVSLIKTASIHVPGLAKNARDPQVIDDELTAAQFLDDKGRPLASLFDFPCHPEVLWEHNPHITADYPGYLRSQVEARTKAPCIFFPGALGGMMTPDVVDHSFEEAESMGKKLASEGLKAIQAVEGVWLSSPNMRKREIRVKLKNPLFKIAFRRKLLPDGRDRQGRILTEVSLLKIGPLWLAAIPGELLPKLGLELKHRLREAGAGMAGVISLANDELGYILPKEDFRYPLNPLKPGKHYEETMSVSKEIGPAVMEAMESLL